MNEKRIASKQSVTQKIGGETKKQSSIGANTKQGSSQWGSTRKKVWRSIDPTVDIVFKKLFGSRKNKNLLIHFLNAVFEFEELARIQDLSILNPYKRIAACSVISKMISSLLLVSKPRILKGEQFRLKFKLQAIRL